MLVVISSTGSGCSRPNTLASASARRHSGLLAHFQCRGHHRRDLRRVLNGCQFDHQHPRQRTRPATARATRPTSRVLPAPAGPVTVTSRYRPSSPATWRTCSSRPTKLVSSAGSHARHGTPRTPPRTYHNRQHETRNSPAETSLRRRHERRQHNRRDRGMPAVPLSRVAWSGPVPAASTWRFYLAASGIL